jgi:hypothetical protein
MAQWRADTQAFDQLISRRYEVMMLANNANGDIVSVTNPLPVTLGSENITISGNVNFVDTVNVASSIENPVHSHITEVGTGGILTVPYLPIGGNVNVTNVVAVTGNVTVNGTVNIGNFPSVQIVNGTIQVNNFPSTQTVNGTINIGTMPEVEIKNDAGNPIPVSGNVTATITGTVTSTVVDGAADAFGRLRISEAFTLGDYKHTYGIDPNFRDTLVNGGTVTHITNQAAARLATSSNASSSAIHQTKMYHNYMPGKSQLIKTTVNFYNPTANVTKRTGYFDANNGIFFEQTGDGTLSFVIRTDTSGTPSDTRKVIQTNWNIDKCDGTGPSGFNLDISNTQIFFTDFQWLGVGRVRCGFVHNGQTIVAHEFYNSNFLPTVYISNPNLPIRCEIRNTGTTTGAYFDQICSTVISEGGYVESGIDFSVNSETTGQSITTANGVYPVLAIRLKNNFRNYPNRVIVRSGNINVYAEDYPAYWALIKLSGLANITLANSTWVSAASDSAIEYNLSATAFTGGDKIDGGIVGTTSPGGSAKGTGVAPINNPSGAKKNFIAQNQDSTDSEIYVVCGQAIGGTVKLWVDFQWREIY